MIPICILGNKNACIVLSHKLMFLLLSFWFLLDLFMDLRFSAWTFLSALMKELDGTRHRSGFAFFNNVGTDFHCLPSFSSSFFLLHPEGKLFTHHVPKRFINRCDNDFVSVVCSTGSNLLDNLNLTGRVFGNCMTAFIARNAP